MSRNDRRRHRRPVVPRRAGAQRVDRRPALVRVQDPRGVAASTIVDSRDAARPSRRCSCCAWSRRASRPGTHETYQVPLGLRPADEGWSERGDLRGRRLDGLRRARRPRRRPRAAARDARQQRVPDRPGRVHLPLGAERRRRPRRHRRRAPGRRRAVELLDRVRRRADHEGVPQGRAGREPGARAAALPDRARLPAHRARWRAGTRSRGATSTPRSGSCRSSWPAPATAGSSRWTSSPATRTGCSTASRRSAS